MKQKEIRVLMVEPGEHPREHPREVTIRNDLDSLQKAVNIDSEYQGLIEIIGIDDGVCILCNEEGKLIGLDGNRRLGNDIIAGVFYVVGEDGRGNLASLSDADMAKYSKLFWEPEYFSEAAVADAIVMYLLEGWPDE